MSMWFLRVLRGEEINRALLPAIVLLASAVAVAGASAKKLDCDNAMTTMDMVACAAKEFKAVDADLNKAYQSVVRELANPGYTKTIGKFRASQRLWLKYRDAYCDWYYRLADGGTIAPIYRFECLKAVTKARTAELRRTRKFISEP